MNYQAIRNINFITTWNNMNTLTKQTQCSNLKNRKLKKKLYKESAFYIKSQETKCYQKSDDEIKNPE